MKRLNIPIFQFFRPLTTRRDEFKPKSYDSSPNLSPTQNILQQLSIHKKVESKDYYNQPYTAQVIETTLNNIGNQNPMLVEPISFDNLNRLISSVDESLDSMANTTHPTEEDDDAENNLQHINRILREEIEGIRRISEGKNTVNKA